MEGSTTATRGGGRRHGFPQGRSWLEAEVGGYTRRSEPSVWKVGLSSWLSPSERWSAPPSPSACRAAGLLPTPRSLFPAPTARDPMHPAAAPQTCHVCSRSDVRYGEQQLSAASGTGHEGLGVAKHGLDLQPLPLGERVVLSAPAIVVAPSIFTTPVIRRSAIVFHRCGHPTALV